MLESERPVDDFTIGAFTHVLVEQVRARVFLAQDISSEGSSVLRSRLFIVIDLQFVSNGVKLFHSDKGLSFWMTFPKRQ